MAVAKGLAVDVNRPLDGCPRGLEIADLCLQFRQLSQRRRQRLRVAAGPLECRDGRRKGRNRFRGLTRPGLAPRQERGRRQGLRRRSSSAGTLAIMHLSERRDGRGGVSHGEVRIGQLLHRYGRQCRSSLVAPGIAPCVEQPDRLRQQARGLVERARSHLRLGKHHQ